jgi:hypothetical protein
MMFLALSMLRSLGELSGIMKKVRELTVDIEGNNGAI